MIATETAIQNLSFLINGKWERPQGSSLHPITNPATGAVIAQVPYASEADIDRTVRTAHAAFATWRDVPVVDRVQVLYRYKDLLEKNLERLARTLTTENGKTFEDARMEVRRAIQMVEFACGAPTLMMGDSLNDVSRGIDSKTIREPLGVCVGITPFNFPAMVPMWMFPFAIACGNTFVLKPSEKVPMTPTVAAELLAEAGVPAGVFNLVQGDKVAVDALLHHPLVKAVSFVGSTPIAKYIYQTAAAQEKQQKYADAVASYRAALKVIPNDPRATKGADFAQHMADGQKALTARKFADATREFEAALKVIPNHVDATSYLKRAREGR